MSYDIVPNVITSDEVITFSPTLTEARLKELGITSVYLESELRCYGVEDFNSLTTLAGSSTGSELKNLLILYISIKAKIEDSQLTDDSLTYINDGYVSSKYDPERRDKYLSTLVKKANKTLILIKKAANIPISSAKREGIGIGVSKPLPKDYGCLVENTLK